MATTITGGLDYRGTAPPAADGGQGGGGNIVFSPTGSASVIVPIGTAGGTCVCYPGSTDPGAKNVLYTAAKYWFGGSQKTAGYNPPAQVGGGVLRRI